MTIYKLWGKAIKPDFVGDKWHKLSVTNPHLRDLITLIAVIEEPRDLKARQKIIDSSAIILEAVEQALIADKPTHTRTKLDELDRAKLVYELKAMYAAGQKWSRLKPVQQSTAQATFSRLRTAYRGLVRFNELSPGASGT
jgi:hypothetical protein